MSLLASYLCFILVESQSPAKPSTACVDRGSRSNSISQTETRSVLKERQSEERRRMGVCEKEKDGQKGHPKVHRLKKKIVVRFVSLCSHFVSLYRCF